MHSIYRVVIDALNHVSRRGKRVVWFYTFSLVLIALFDGFGLIAISKALNSNYLSKEISSNDQIIPLGILIMTLFLLRSFLSSMTTWFSFSSFAKEEVSIGQSNFKKFQNMELLRQLEKYVSPQNETASFRCRFCEDAKQRRLIKVKLLYKSLVEQQ